MAKRTWSDLVIPIGTVLMLIWAAITAFQTEKRRAEVKKAEVVESAAAEVLRE